MKMDYESPEITIDIFAAPNSGTAIDASGVGNEDGDEEW